jgi:D-3-phosphoglycerate dehydrogenase
VTQTQPINYINAPVLAAEQGITTTQAVGINGLDYPNLIACRAYWDGGQRLLAGVLFGGGEPRIVQVDNYRLEAKPEGVVLIMQNQDVPGVIGQVGTILSAYEVNIGEWRLGRDQPGGEALSFINLDSEPPEAVLDALSKIRALTRARLVKL